MSFLTRSINDTMPFKKAVFSLWFRVPGSTIQTIADEFNAWIDLPPDSRPPRRRFMGIVPLLTFGDVVKSKEFFFPSEVVGTHPGVNYYGWHDGSGFPDCAGAGWVLDHTQAAGPITEQQWSFDRGDDPADPHGGDDLDGSYIGVDCRGQDPYLGVCIMMPQDNTAEFAGSLPKTVSESYGGVVPIYGGEGVCGPPGGTYIVSPGDPYYNLMPGRICYTQTFGSSVHTQDMTGSGADVGLGYVPECFLTRPMVELPDVHDVLPPKIPPGAKVKPDHWHHVLLSFDLAGNVSAEGRLFSVSGSGGGFTPPGGSPFPTTGDRVSSECRMWIAFDNHNLTKKTLSVYWPTGHDDNTIITVNANNVANDTNYSITSTHPPFAECEGIDSTLVTTRAKPTYDFTPTNISLGTLGLPAIADYVDAVRHVEMAELQIFLDISLDTSNEDYRKAFINKGKPVPPTQQRDPSNPNSFSGSIELLGKKPEILLHGANKWQKGMNTGGSGSFTPFGQIERYKPDPSLGGPQGDPQ